MSSTITIPNYGNDTKEYSSSSDAPKVSPKIRTLPVPMTMADTGLPEELLVQRAEFKACIEREGIGTGH